MIFYLLSSLLVQLSLQARLPQVSNIDASTASQQELQQPPLELQGQASRKGVEMMKTRRTREQILLDARIPTEEEVQSLSLQDLIARRSISRARTSCAAKAFAQRFAQHPRVRELDPRTSGLSPAALAKRWTAMRLEACQGNAELRMTNAVQYHLRHVVKADAYTQSIIEGHWSAFNREGTTRRYLTKRKARFAADPLLRAKQYASTKRNRQLRVEREATEQDVTFAQLIEREQHEHHENHHLPWWQGRTAMQIEEATRQFYHIQRPRSRAMRQMREFLLENHFPPHQIMAAAAARRKWIDSCWQKEKKEKKKRKGLVSKTGSSNASPPPPAAGMGRPENHRLSRLLHCVDWWQPGRCR